MYKSDNLKQYTKDLRNLIKNDDINFMSLKKYFTKYAEELHLKVTDDLVNKSLFNFEKNKLITQINYLNILHFGFSTKKKSLDFWISRGWRPDEVEEKIKSLSSFSYSYLLNKGYSKEEAKEIISNRVKSNHATKNPNFDTRVYGRSVDYYKKRVNKKTGVFYTEDEIHDIIVRLQSNASKIRWKKHKENPTYKSLNTRIEYYIEKGLSIKEAEIALKERQATNKVSYYISKFGKEKGLIKYNERLKNYSNKIKEDWKKNPYKRWNSGKRYSNSSILFFDSILNELKDLKNFVVYYKNNEFFIVNDSSIFFYDFCIKELKLIIEYNGLAFHPKTENQNWKSIWGNFSAAEIYKKDMYKKDLAESKGFTLLTIFEDEETEKKQTIINEISKRIRERHDNS